jgi:methyl-accepting chemotaxis protein
MEHPALLSCEVYMSNTIDQRGKYPEPQSVPISELEGQLASLDALERFAKTFEASARRWELVVYPSLFAFVILAAYGFFLVFSLANDVAVLARSVDTQMGENMASMSSNIKNLALNIDHMAENINTMALNLGTMTKDVHTLSTEVGSIAADTKQMKPINDQITSLGQSVHLIAIAVPHMQRDMSIMNQSISRPLSFMNNFMPW